jgi:hypothetical protein
VVRHRRDAEIADIEDRIRLTSEDAELTSGYPPKEEVPLTADATTLIIQKWECGLYIMPRAVTLAVSLEDFNPSITCQTAADPKERTHL